MKRIHARLDGISINYPLGAQIHEYIRAWAKTHPDKEAILINGTATAYGELCSEADAIADGLVSAGVESSQVVAVDVPFGITLVATLLAVGIVGATYIVVDRSWPQARIAEALSVSKASYIVSTDKSHARTGDLEIDELAGAASGAQTAPNSMCVFFTSGSSGKPKAICAPSKGILRIALDPLFKFDESCRMLQVSPTPWDAFAMELWCPLIGGGTTILEPNRPVGPHDLERNIRLYGVNSLFLTTSLFNVIVEEDINSLDGLKLCMTGGERASHKNISQFVESHPMTELIHVYGPAESAVFSSASTVRLPVGPNVSMGKPVANTTIFLAETSSGPETVFEIGIAGDGLCGGYLGDAKQTADKFVLGKVSERSEDVVIYMSGDLASLDADDNLYFEGRMDSEFKIRGVRVDPREIEQLAESIDGISRAIAIGLPLGEAAKREIALLYTTTPGQQVTREATREILSNRLQRQLVPRLIVPIESLPLTATGKVSQPELAAILKSQPGASAFASNHRGDADEATRTDWPEARG